MRCPSTFVGGDNKYFQDFENQAAVKAMGEIISYMTPFCGRHSIKNPKYVYEAPETKLGISLSQYGVVSKILPYFWHFLRIFFSVVFFSVALFQDVKLNYKC